ncbi:MAG TPA: phospholipase D-like domain-containing protein [Pyrinomonadaceae bacterium]|nr:phospholipase D-like domain-containing protein [Pyrinomonadaceae bacterium]
MSVPTEKVEKIFRGIVHVTDNDGVSLDANGVEVVLDGDRERFRPLDGAFAAVTGWQEGNVIRNAAPLPQTETVEAEAEGPDIFAPVIAAIKSQLSSLMAIEGVVGVTPGFRTSGEDGREDVAIVVVTERDAAPATIPANIAGIPVRTREVTPLETVDGVLPLSVWEGIVPEAAPNINYVPPDPPPALQTVKVHNITCHVGPDSGWKTLKPFLEGTTEKLTVAMYEFYADHIVDTVTRLGEESDAKLNMILQVSGNDEEVEATLRDSWSDRLEFTRASVSGPNRIFNNSYHTKVAVRDSTAFWLSSGNWSPTSQPLIKPGSEQVLYSKGNREWHVIIEDEPLAKMYEQFIEYDIKQAREVGAPEAAPLMPDLLIPESAMVPEAMVVQDHPFEAKTFATSGAPVKVQPLMSPDNYAAEVLKLIEHATRSLYLQFSYIRQPSTATFDKIISAISQKMKENLDVRVLVGSNQEPDHSTLLVNKRKWKRSMFRRQSGKVHNKGILIDGKIAVVGSNNWSSDGTQYNRDTSLVFFSRPIAQYFTEVFMFDWDNLSKPIDSAQEVVPEVAPETGPTPLGMVRIPWQAWFDE